MSPFPTYPSQSIGPPITSFRLNGAAAERARSNPSIQGTPEKLRFSVPSLRSVAPDLER